VTLTFVMMTTMTVIVFPWMTINKKSNIKINRF
jgi:hypothetical protein